MVTVRETQRAITFEATEKIDWWVISLVNDMLKEMSIKAKFEEEEKPVKDMNKTHIGTELKLYVGGEQ